MRVTARESTLVHEAGHVVGGLLAGHRIEAVRLGATKRTPSHAGTTTFDGPESSDFDFYGHLVAVLMGPMAGGKPPPAWPPLPDPDNSDAWAATRIVSHLRLSKSDYLAAVAIAGHHLGCPFAKEAVARVADALGKHGALTDRMVRDAVGPRLLEWFARADPPGELTA